MNGDLNARSGFCFEDEVCINKFLLAYLKTEENLEKIVIRDPEYEKIDFAILLSSSTDIYQTKDRKNISADDFVAIVKEFRKILEEGDYKNPKFYLICSSKLETQWIKTLKRIIEDAKERQRKLSLKEIRHNVAKKIEVVGSLFSNLTIEITDKEVIERDSLGCLCQIPQISNETEVKRHKELLSNLINLKMQRLTNGYNILLKKDLECIFEQFSSGVDKMSEMLKSIQKTEKTTRRIEGKLEIVNKKL